MDICVRGASEHNLRSVDLDLPRERLIVFTGVSGSGKSSLAFDTLHAESQRRFVEALSSYVRAQFGASRKPAYEQLTGLTPSIGVSQRGHAQPSPRSTVGTLTEVHDLLRVLYARTARMHCPGCGADVTPTASDAIVRALAGLPEGTRLVVCARLVRKEAPRAQLRAYLEELGRQGFARVRIDGAQHALDELPVLDGRVGHDVDVVVDRIKVAPDRRERVQEAVDAALRVGGGALIAEVEGQDRVYTSRARCLGCDRAFPEASPRLFSFNAPVGACPGCQGLGEVRALDASRVVVDPARTLAEGAVEGLAGASKKLVLAALAARGVPADVPWSALTWQQRELVLHGDSGATSTLEGVLRVLERRMPEHLVEVRACADCGGSRLGEVARAARVQGRALPEVLGDTLVEVRGFVAALPDDPVSRPLAEELGRRIDFMVRTGLGYLTLGRAADTLSGGELQRLRLAAQAGNALSGVLYVLDEPTAGLHPEDTEALVAVLTDLRDAGNTVLVVEHDPAVVAAADLVVDFGPGAGVAGGRVTFRGTPDALLQSETVTGRWLSGRDGPAPLPPRTPSGWITVRNASGHNLRGIDVRLPLGVLAAVTGVSGSGKSSLVNDTLGRALSDRKDALPHDGIDGRQAVRRVVRVDATPLGRSAQSTPATATKIWDAIRQLYARTPEARVRGFGPERFSAAQPGGRCEACEGRGVRRVEMQYLPDVDVPCEVCDGKRFDEATLACTWKGASVADVLAMPVREARGLFGAVPQVAGVLSTLDALGLGYLPLGQPADTLSGGEAQRVKLARELGKPGEVSGTLYLLDEPSVGLHPADVALLVEALRQLVDHGGSVLCVEHDPALLRACDWLVELGPGAGEAGGVVIAAGTPEALRASGDSRTGRWL